MQHFSDQEFLCACGCGLGVREMDGSLLYKLGVARTIAGIPFVITSAVRCAKHNAAVGGADRSAHVTGHAVDIRCTSDADRYQILRAAVLADFQRVGVAQHFIHLDTSPLLNRERVWVYPTRGI